MNYSLTQILSVDFQEEFYNKLNKEVIYFTNIAELHQYRKNKFIHHICFNVMNTYSLEAIIYEKLRLHNRAYPDDILQLTGVIKQDNEGYLAFLYVNQYQINKIDITDITEKYQKLLNILNSQYSVGN